MTPDGADFTIKLDVGCAWAGNMKKPAACHATRIPTHRIKGAYTWKDLYALAYILQLRDAPHDSSPRGATEAAEVGLRWLVRGVK